MLTCNQKRNSWFQYDWHQAEHLYIQRWLINLIAWPSIQVCNISVRKLKLNRWNQGRNMIFFDIGTMSFHFLTASNSMLFLSKKSTSLVFALPSNALFLWWNQIVFCHSWTICRSGLNCAGGFVSACIIFEELSFWENKKMTSLICWPILVSDMIAICHPHHYKTSFYQLKYHDAIEWQLCRLLSLGLYQQLTCII